MKSPYHPASSNLATMKGTLVDLIDPGPLPAHESDTKKLPKSHPKMMAKWTPPSQYKHPVPQEIPSDGDFPDLPVSSLTMKPQLNGRPQEPGSTPSSHRVSGSIHNMKVHF